MTRKSAETGTHKSTTPRLIVLDHQRLIRKTETGKYALGLRLFEFATRAVRGLQLRRVVNGATPTK